MAKEKQGRMSGSAGTLNFYTVNGEQRVRRKAHHNKSKRTIRRKRTVAQANQISRFAFAARFAMDMKELFNQSFETMGSQIGKCQAIRYMLSSAVYGEGKNLKIDFSKLLVARGRTLTAAGVSATSSTPGKIEFTWEDNTGDNRSAAGDEAILVAYSEKFEECFFTMKGGERKLCRGELMVPSNAGEEYHTWISFVKKDGSAADSVYCGVVKV